MVGRKLDGRAFEHWLSLGDGRTFADVARHYGCDKAQVSRLARRERWRERLETKVEPAVRERVERSIVESLADVRTRQAELGKQLQQRGLRALQQFPIADVRDALKAIDLGVKVESQARELNTKKRVDVSVEHVLRERFERFVEASPPPRQVTNGQRPRLTVEVPSLEELEAEHGEEEADE